MTNRDLRSNSTRNWSRGKLTLVIGAVVVVFLVASSVFWLPLLTGTDETPALEQTTTAP